MYVGTFDDEPHQDCLCELVIHTYERLTRLTGVGSQIVRGLHRFGAVRSLHLVTPQILHELFQLRREVSTPDVHDVFASVRVVQDIFGQSLGGWVRWVELVDQ